MSPWRKTVYAAYVAQVFSIMGFSCVLPFIPLYIKELGIQGEDAVARWAGIVTACAALSLAIFSPIWGHFADRFGKKLMVLRSMLGGTMVLTLMSFTRTVQELAICRALQGMLTGTITANTALVASVAPRERAGHALGMMHGAIYIGNTLGPLIGGLAADQIGRRAAFRVGALFLFVGACLIKFAVNEGISGAQEEEEDAAPSGSFWTVLTAKGFLAATMCLFAIRFANSVAAPIFPLLVEKLHGSQEAINTITGTLIAVAGISAAIASWFLGSVSDRWGHKKMLIASCLFVCVVSLLHVVARGVPDLFVMRILFGVGAAGIMPAVGALVRKATHHKDIGKAFGATATLGSLGWAVGPMAGGYLAAELGLRSPFVLMGAALAVSALLVKLTLPRDRKQETDLSGGAT